MSFRFAEEIMSMELPDPDHKTFGKILAVKQAVMSSILTATSRTRPGDLRDREDDGMEGFLREMKQAAGEETVDLDDLLH